MSPHLPLVLTMGDPAGIGPELTAKAWQAREEKALPAFYVVGAPSVYSGLPDAPPVETILDPAEAKATYAHAIPVFPIALPAPAQLGRPNSANAPAILESIRIAVDHCQSGKAGGMVTNPIAKHVLMDAGFTHPGHTEYLAELAEVSRTVMMLSGGGLRSVPVTIHCALRDVLTRLTATEIVDTGRIVADSLKRGAGIENPRLAVAGLNPHAGEDGRFGNEDRDIVRPAVERLRAEGIDAQGPFPADTMFHAERRADYDAAICMYHDQALIPVKTLDFHNGVNITLGMPFIRTSPDHGTAFDIAGRGIARTDSLIAAIRAAHDMRMDPGPDRTHQ